VIRMPLIELDVLWLAVHLHRHACRRRDRLLSSVVRVRRIRPGPSTLARYTVTSRSSGSFAGQVTYAAEATHT